MVISLSSEGRVSLIPIINVLLIFVALYDTFVAICGCLIVVDRKARCR